MIALIIPTSRQRALAETIFVTVLDGLRIFLADRGLDLLVLLCGQEEDAYAYLRRAVARRIADGIIIADTQRIDPRIEHLLEKKIPFATFGRSLSGGSQPWIDLDFAGVAERAVARLVAEGHRRIALATSATEINYGYIFADAYRAALQRRGLPVDEGLILRVENTEDGGHEFGRRILAMRKRPTAALLVNGTMAVGLYRRLSEASLAPGRDFSVIGFQEEPSARFLAPKVTCFRAELRSLGVRLGEALLATMPAYAPAESEAPPVQEIWPMELVPGESDRATVEAAAGGIALDHA